MKEMIRIENLSKRYELEKKELTALEDINLTINKGEIFGIIGMSGAGKSTLIRCINYLEHPTTGSVTIDGKNLSKLNSRELRKVRKETAMIFQQFHLLMQKNVIDNVCFPLKLSGVKGQKAKDQALKLLEVVGLSDKAHAYPSQLSGGQKQRVAIARALACNPKVLLCDEATSALDPQTTQSVLSLLKEINQTYGITIVLITHQMSVVSQICSHVALLSKGRLVEQGTVSEVFLQPKTIEAKQMIQQSAYLMEVNENVG